MCVCVCVCVHVHACACVHANNCIACSIEKLGTRLCLCMCTCMYPDIVDILIVYVCNVWGIMCYV